MAESDIQLVERTAPLQRGPEGRLRPAVGAWLPELRRLFLGAAGPVPVAGTQFAASLLLWGHGSAKACISRGSPSAN